jgi:hypothetical protein
MWTVANNVADVSSRFAGERWLSMKVIEESKGADLGIGILLSSEEATNVEVAVSNRQRTEPMAIQDVVVPAEKAVVGPPFAHRATLNFPFPPNKGTRFVYVRVRPDNPNAKIKYAFGNLGSFRS